MPWNGLPAAGGIDEALVFRAAPVGHRSRLGLAEPALRQEAAAERAIGEQLHAAFAAERPTARRRRGGRPARTTPGWWRSGCRRRAPARRCAASKLVRPIAPIRPSSRSRFSSCRASSQAGCSKVHQWNCSRSTCSTPSRSQPLLDAARARSRRSSAPAAGTIW